MGGVAMARAALSVAAAGLDRCPPGWSGLVARPSLVVSPGRVIDPTCRTGLLPPSSAEATIRLA